MPPELGSLVLSKGHLPTYMQVRTRACTHVHAAAPSLPLFTLVTRSSCLRCCRCRRFLWVGVGVQTVYSGSQSRIRGPMALAEFSPGYRVKVGAQWSFGIRGWEGSWGCILGLLTSQGTPDGGWGGAGVAPGMEDKDPEQQPHAQQHPEDDGHDLASSQAPGNCGGTRVRKSGGQSPRGRRPEEQARAERRVRGRACGEAAHRGLAWAAGHSEPFLRRSEGAGS